MFAVFLLLFINGFSLDSENNFLEQRLELEKLKAISLKKSAQKAGILPNLEGGFATSNIGSREVFLQQRLPWTWLRGFDSDILNNQLRNQDLNILKTERENEAFKIILKLSTSILADRVKHLAERLRILKDVLNNINKLPQQVSLNRLNRFAVESKQRVFLIHQAEIQNQYKLLSSQLEMLGLQKQNQPFLNLKKIFLPHNIEYLWENNMGIKKLTIETESEEVLLNKEWAQLLPEITLGVRNKLDWGSIEENVLQVGVALPAWDLNISGISSQKALVNAKKIEKELLINKNRMEFQKLKSNFDEAYEAIKIYPPELINKLEKDLRNAEVMFRQNALSAINFLELEESGHEQIELVLNSQLKLLTAYLEIIGPTDYPMNFAEILQ